ncbi:DUF1104 domain-containing protein [Helicobacter sp. MIT 11-5569]|uniref:DUF1104 domain-containing protein n=1 Tax=Helicobacter sp. MIT 11-5569 TaxID=1548151 RepID=UPI00068FB000|nr:DUF1104 domain-containing protein [Helicobacter sp. MIT 11-5569]TLD84535.1 DUF1104 domain-containing protein [Helicobacter sp. MIT 11-5569]
MKSKFLLSVIAVGMLSMSAFGADYSKLSNEKLIEMSGDVAPKDYPDFTMEVHKRTQEMKVKDAEIFYDKLHQTRRNAHDAMSLKERREYRDAIRVEMQKRIDTMSVKEAREKGLLRGGYHHQRNGWKDSRGYGRGAGGSHRDCAPCPRY